MCSRNLCWFEMGRGVSGPALGRGLLVGLNRVFLICRLACWALASCLIGLFVGNAKAPQTEIPLKGDFCHSELRHALIPCCHSGSAREPAFSETMEKELIRCRGDTEPPTGPKVHPGCSLSLACVSEPREAAEVMSVECRRDTRRWNVGPIVPHRRWMSRTVVADA